MSSFSKFCPSDAFLLLTANVLLQIAVVAVLAGAIAMVFARHRAAVRHAIWLTALVCVLLSPAAAYLAATAERPLFSLHLLPSVVTSDVEAGAASVPAVVTTERLPLPLLSHNGRGMADSGTAVEEPAKLASLAGRNASRESARVSECGNVSPLSEEPSESPQNAAAEKKSGDESPHSKRETLFGLAVAFWVTGALILFVRLLHGCWHIARLRRRLRPIDGDRLAVLADVRRVLNVQTLPPLAMLPRTTALPGPITIGLFRPIVVVPEEILATLDPRGLHDVLIHEFAHAVRRDPLVGFVVTVHGFFQKWYSALGWCAL